MRNHFASGDSRRYYATVGTCYAVVLLCAPLASSAANVVPASKMSKVVSAVTVDKKKPSACSGITLDTLVLASAGGGTTASGSGNDLLLGTNSNDTLNGNGGNDCIIAGGGTNSLSGGAGTDVCIGKVTDTFNANCETQIKL